MAHAHNAVPFVSRAGLKLDHALREFSIDVTDSICADFGCNIGGFTDCLLQRGAAKVYAIDTGYGALAWKLRNDPRVMAMERTNALHAKPQAAVDLVVIDLAWTPQRLAMPAALGWLAPHGRIVSLVKPHYELDEDEKRLLLHEGRLDPGEARRVLRRVMEQVPAWGVEVLAHTQSPLTGGKSSRGAGAEGNIEFLVLARANRIEPHRAAIARCSGTRGRLSHARARGRKPRCNQEHDERDDEHPAQAIP